VVGLPLIWLTKEEVKVENTKPLEGDVGRVEDDGGSGEEEEEGDGVVEKEGDEVLTPVEKRVDV
jgi:hypothetical protein